VLTTSLRVDVPKATTVRLMATVEMLKVFAIEDPAPEKLTPLITGPEPLRKQAKLWIHGSRGYH
jgi:hypothetical protein